MPKSEESDPPEGYEADDTVTASISLLSLINGYDHNASNELSNPPTPLPTGTPGAGGSVTVIKVDALNGARLANACFDVTATALGDVVAAVTAALTVELTPLLQALGLQGAILDAALTNLLQPILAPIIAVVNGGETTSTATNQCTDVNGEVVVDGMLSNLLNAILIAVGGVLDQTDIDDLLSSLGVDLTIAETAPPPGYEQKDAVTTQITLLDLLNGSDQEVTNDALPTATATNTSVATETPTATATSDATKTPTATPTQPGGGGNGGSVTIIKVDALTDLPIAGACFDVTAEILGGGGALLGPIRTYLLTILDPVVVNPLMATLSLLLNGADASDTGAGCSGVDGKIVISGLLAGILNPILTTLGAVLDATQLDALLATLLTRVTITETAPPAGYEGADATTTDIQLLQLLTGYQTQIENQPIATATATATSTSIATETARATNTAVATETATATATETATATATATASVTASATASATATEAPTETATATATSTEVSTATATATGSMEPTATSTTEPTETATATSEPTETATATATSPATETETATATATNEPGTATATGTATETATATPTGTVTPVMVTLGIWVIDCDSDPGTVTGNDVALGNLPSNCRVDEGVQLSATSNGVEIPGGPFVTGPDGFVSINAPLGSAVVVTEDVGSVNGGQTVLLSVRALQAAPTGIYLPRENPITIADAQEGESVVFVNLLQVEPTATATASATPPGGATSTPGPSATATTAPVTDLPSTGGGLFESTRSISWMLGLLLAVFLLMLGVARTALDPGRKTRSRRD